MSWDNTASDLDLVRWADESYRHRIFAAGDVEALYVRQTKYDVLAFRGTTLDFADIIADLRTVPWWDARLGWCHKGLMSGVGDDFWPAYWRHLLSGDKPLWITGHSKGGGNGLIFAGLAAAAGKPPVGVVTFGCPYVAGGRLAGLLTGVEVRQYRNGADIVPTVPRLLGALGVFGHVRDLLVVGAASAERDGPFLDHRIADYRRIIEARLAPQAT